MGDINKLLNFRRKPVAVPVPDLGETYHLRVMSGAERDDFEDETYKLNGKSVEMNRKNFRARLIVRCLCDEAGKRTLKDDQAAALGEVPADVLDVLTETASRINGMSKKDVEELAKNSLPAPSGGPGSSSPSSTEPPADSSNG